VLTRHRRMLFNPRYGVVGLFAYPYFFFLEMLGPVIELGGYLSFVITLVLGRVNALYAGVFFLIAFVLGAALSLAAVGLEELSFRRYPKAGDLARLMLLAFIEPFGYRQLNSLWRMRGLVSALRRKTGWGEMTRKGFGAVPAK